MFLLNLIYLGLILSLSVYIKIIIKILSSIHNNNLPLQFGHLTAVYCFIVRDLAFVIYDCASNFCSKGKLGIVGQQMSIIGSNLWHLSIFQDNTFHCCWTAMHLRKLIAISAIQQVISKTVTKLKVYLVPYYPYKCQYKV